MLSRVDGTQIHPAFIRLAILYSEGVICGSNARCIALLGAFKKVNYIHVLYMYVSLYFNRSVSCTMLTFFT